MELYLRVRLACANGMSGRQAARHFNISRESVRKILSYSEPPGYRRQKPVRRPKLDAFIAIIDAWLEGDKKVLAKQHHTAKRIFDRLRSEHGFTGGYTIVKDYVREHTPATRIIGIPAPGARGLHSAARPHTNIQVGPLVWGRSPLLLRRHPAIVWHF